jgi:hypothetical protein
MGSLLTSAPIRPARHARAGRPTLWRPHAHGARAASRDRRGHGCCRAAPAQRRVDGGRSGRAARPGWRTPARREGRSEWSGAVRARVERRRKLAPRLLRFELLLGLAQAPGTLLSPEVARQARVLDVVVAGQVSKRLPARPAPFSGSSSPRTSARTLVESGNTVLNAQYGCGGISFA